MISKPLTEIDTRNPNLIFNDLIQEAFITRNEKLKNLIKKFLLNFNTNNNQTYTNNSDTYQKLVENLIKVYTHENGLFSGINKAFRAERKSTFLASAIILLNDAIRSNFPSIRYEAKCYRKANLTQEEFDLYFSLFNNTQRKSFCWKTFISATKNVNADIRNNINSSIYENLDYNTIFTIEFSSDSWGLDISELSLSKYQDEILLPANSVFEIVNLTRDEKDQIIHIGLVKLDKNLRKSAAARAAPTTHTAPATRSSVLSNTWLGKGNKIIEKEIVLLQNDLQENSHKYCFVRDEDNLFKIKLALFGPPQTAYANGVFQVNIFVPEGYPNKAPSIKFATKLYHPNISFESGEVDAEILEKIWRPSLSIAKLVNVIYGLLAQPKDSFENLNSVQKKEFVEDRLRFEFNAVEVTRRFANFKGVIEDMQRRGNLSEFDARTKLLMGNAFETSV